MDDDSADLALITDALRRNPRVRGVTAMSDPRSALFELAQHKVHADLILLDINMPRIDGFTFIEALREAPWCAHTPVVLLTTWGACYQVERARRAHVAGYIMKPPSFRDLRSRIDGLIDQMVVGEA